MKTWQRIRRWPPWVWALTGVLAVGIVVAAVILTGDSRTNTAAPGTTTTLPATTITSSMTTTTQTTTQMTTTSRASTTTRPSTTTARAPAGQVPGIVIASAGSAGGSGEVQVEWNAVARATGYRVYHTDSTGHHAQLMVDINIVTGRTTAATGVGTVWSDEHNYVPYQGPLTGMDHSSRFRYVDAISSTTRYYRVRAYNAAGAGPLSAVTGGTPVTGPPPSLPAE